MRLLELKVPGPVRPADPGAALRLHPRLAVVRGGHTQRAQMVEQIMSVIGGQASASHGLVEVHGMLFDFSGETAVLLALDGAVQPVLRSSDLPGIEGSDATRQRRHLERQHDDARRQVAQCREQAAAALAEREDLERRLRVVDDELGRRRAVVDEANERVEGVRRDQREAIGARDASEQRRRVLLAELARLDQQQAEVNADEANLSARLAEATRARDACAAALAQADARIDASNSGTNSHPADSGAEIDAARAALSAAHLDLRAAEARLETLQTQISLADAGPDDLLRASRRRRDELAAELASLDLGDPREVEAALAAALQATPHPNSAAGQLAGRLIEVAERRQAIERAQVPTSADGIAVARERVERAHAEVTSASAGGRAAVMDPGARATIERAHEDVLEAEDKASRRFAGAGAKARLAELRETETALLTQFGLSSFSDYLLSASTARIDPTAQIRLSVAERELADAQAELAAVMSEAAATPSVPELGQLDMIESGLRAEAVGLLGYDPGRDLISALRSFDPEAGPLLANLETALARVGVGADNGTVLDAGRGWMADRSMTERRAQEIQGQLASIDRELAAGPASAPGSLATELAVVEDEVDRLSAIRAAASAALVEARRRADELESQAVPIDDRHATLATLLSDREALQRQLQDSETAAGAIERHVEAVRAARLDHQADAESTQRQLAAAEAEAATHHERAERLSHELQRLEQALLRVPTRGVTSPAADSPDAALLAAQAAESAATSRLAQAQLRADELWAFTERARAAEADAPSVPSISFDDLEFYVLGRLAAQRAVGLVGSVPLVIDDAMAGLPAEDIVRLLERLDRMSASVQVVYLTEDPVVLRWAGARPADRVSLVEIPAVQLSAR